MGNAKLTGYVIALLMIGGFIFAVMQMMGNLKDNRLIQDLKDQNALLEQRAMDHERQVAEAKEEFARIEAKAKESAAIKERFQAAVQKKALLAEEIITINDARSGLLDDARSERSRLLATAKKKKLDTLLTTSGKEYKDVEIQEAKLEGLRITHVDGTANISPKDLPPPWRRSLGLDIAIPDAEPTATTEPANTTTPASLAPRLTDTTATAQPATQPLSSADSERKIMDDTRDLAKISQLRALARRYRAEAVTQDKQAVAHDHKAAIARAANRPSMQDACATKAREIAAGLRAKAGQADKEADKLEGSLQSRPTP